CAQHLDPRPEGGRALDLLTPPPQHTTGRDARNRLLDQPRLPGAGLATDEDQPGTPRCAAAICAATDSSSARRPTKGRPGGPASGIGAREVGSELESRQASANRCRTAIGLRDTTRDALPHVR